MKINPLRIKEIENITLDVLATAYTKSAKKFTPPVQLKKILDANNIKLDVVTFKEQEILGAYDKNNKIIYVSENEPYARKAFTIAHELGHFFLHAQKDNEFFYRSDIMLLDQDGQEETEANAFAASLLMPSYQVKKFWNLYKSTRVIAFVFKVSHATAFYRLKNLNLIK